MISEMHELSRRLASLRSDMVVDGVEYRQLLASAVIIEFSAAEEIV